MRSRSSLRLLAFGLMLAGMFALVGHTAAMAAGVDQCLDRHGAGAHHSEAWGELDSERPLQLPATPSGPCCVGACVAAILVEEHDLGARPGHAGPVFRPTPPGLHPGGLERPPRV